MLRQSISLLVLGVLGLLVGAESAVAGPLDRLRDRRNNVTNNEGTSNSGSLLRFRDRRNNNFSTTEATSTSSPVAVQGTVPMPVAESQPINETQPSAKATTSVTESQPVVNAEQQPVYRSRFARRRGQVSYYSPSTQQSGQSQSGQSQPAQAQGYRSFYNAQQSQPEGAVVMNIKVPADAQVWFDGFKTAQTGESRQFITPRLLPGKSYSYQIKATWNEKGQPVTRKQTVSLKAGDSINLDLQNEGKPALREQNEGRPSLREKE